MAEEIAPIRLGIVGCGGVRPLYGSVLRLISGLQVTALLEEDSADARALVRELNRPPLYSDYDCFLTEASLDAVLVASPVSQRARHAADAALAGKHILCEEPPARTLDECDAILRAAAQSHVLLMTAFLRRFDEKFLCAGRLIEEGRLGELSRVRCEGRFPVQEEGAQTWESVFEGHANHAIDLCRWWLGDVETVSADVDVGQAAHRPDGRADLILNHARGVSIHHVSRGPRKRPAVSYLLEGSEGTLEVRVGIEGSPSAFRMVIHRPGHAAEDVTRLGLPPMNEKTRDYHRGKRALEHFADCIRFGHPPRVTGLDGRKVMEVILAAYLSSRERTKITLPLARAADENGVV